MTLFKVSDLKKQAVDLDSVEDVKAFDEIVRLLDKPVEDVKAFDEKLVEIRDIVVQRLKVKREWP